MEVYLIRHTTPKIKRGICYGQSDIPLAESFLVEANKLLKVLPEGIEVIYSSPLTRCYTLAERITTEKHVIDTRLLEMDFGDWEMKKWDDINQQQLNTWMKNFVSVRTPNGENYTDLNDRVNNFLQEVFAHRYKTIAIITHAGVIRCMVTKVLRIDLKDTFQMPFDYGGVTKITLNSQGSQRVQYLNRVYSH